MGNPTPTSGSKGDRDLTGIRKISLMFIVEGPEKGSGADEPWTVLDTWLPSSFPLGLPYTTRSYSKSDDGNWDLTLNFEGMPENAESTDDAEIDHASVEDPIETFDRFPALKKKFKGTLDERGTVIWPATLKDPATGTSGRNPIFGQSHFLNDNPVLRCTFNERKYDPSYLKGICKIDARPRVPKGAERMVETEGGKSWLKKRVSVKYRGNVWQYVVEWLQGYWIPDIYASRGS